MFHSSGNYEEQQAQSPPPYIMAVQHSRLNLSNKSPIRKLSKGSRPISQQKLMNQASMMLMMRKNQENKRNLRLIQRSSPPP